LCRELAPWFRELKLLSRVDEGWLITGNGSWIDESMQNPMSDFMAKGPPKPWRVVLENSVYRYLLWCEFKLAEDLSASRRKP
jgi:hypothetical protein